MSELSVSDGVFFFIFCGWLGWMLFGIFVGVNVVIVVFVGGFVMWDG